MATIKRDALARNIAATLERSEGRFIAPLFSPEIADRMSGRDDADRKSEMTETLNEARDKRGATVTDNVRTQYLIAASAADFVQSLLPADDKTNAPVVRDASGVPINANMAPDDIAAAINRALSDARAKAAKAHGGAGLLQSTHFRMSIYLAAFRDQAVAFRTAEAAQDDAASEAARDAAMALLTPDGMAEIAVAAFKAAKMAKADKASSAARAEIAKALKGGESGAILAAVKVGEAIKGSGKVEADKLSKLIGDARAKAASLAEPTEPTEPTEPEGDAAEPKGDDAAEPKGDDAAEPKGDDAAEPKGDDAAEPKGDDAAEPKGDDAAEPKGDDAAEPKGDDAAEPKGDDAAEPKGDDAAEPKGAPTPGAGGVTLAGPTPDKRERDVADYTRDAAPIADRAEALRTTTRLAAWAVAANVDPQTLADHLLATAKRLKIEADRAKAAADASKARRPERKARKLPGALGK